MRAISAQFSELTDDNLIVTVKKTETAIPRDQIDRIDARAPSGSRITRETNTTETVNPDGTTSGARLVCANAALGQQAEAARPAAASLPV